MSSSVDDHGDGSDGTHLREVRLRLTRSGFAALGVEELLSLQDECTQVRFRSLSCRGSSGTCMIEADRRVNKDRFETLGYVDSFDLVGHGPDRFEYLVRMELPRCADVFDEREGEFYVDGPLSLGEDGLTFTAIATQEALDSLSTAVGAVADLGTAFEVLRVGKYSGRSGHTDGLTERQHEVLVTAYERDYFDVPRGVTPDELAAEIGLDKSTVLEHLRRAEQNLLDGTLGDGRGEFTT